jgi:molecular chaperone GrpE
MDEDGMSDDTNNPEAEDFEFSDAGEGQPADAGLISGLEAEVASLKEQVLRFAADAENTKRRAEREANDARAFAIQKFARDLLGVADNLARAISSAKPDESNAALTQLLTGIEMTDKELNAAFERNGLKKVDPGPGVKFDPHQHQAVMEQPSTEVAGGGVIQTLQTGYELFGRIVRPAMVVVAAKGSTGAAQTEPVTANPYAASGGGEGDHAVDTKA